MLPNFPINEFIQAALHGTADRVPFSPYPDGTYKSTVFIASPGLEAKIATALAPYGITPVIGHDQTHHKIRRIKLVISAEQVAAAAAQYTTETLSRLKETSGHDWYYEPFRNSYISGFVSPDDANALEDSLRAAGLKGCTECTIKHDNHTIELGDQPGRSLQSIADEKGIAVTDASSVIEVDTISVSRWMAAKPKAAQVGTADTRQGAVRS